MGSTNYLGKSKLGYRAKSGSSGGSDREMSGKFRRTKIKRPNKMGEYGLKRIPDYTELAYKEAVSKLKYFLSGNSAPSVRSYGSYNKEEDDIDKKYHTLAEYKPKPRLTAKYTSLYADSLNNYTPPQTNAPASTAEATNPDVVHFIQKQEEYIEQLERESQYCRDELNNLLGKVKEVISENEHLHEAQKDKIISRMFHTYEGSETDDVDDSTGLDSDNKVTPLKTRKARPRATKLEGPNIVFESRIAELEAQLTQSKIDLKKVQEENSENKRKLAAGLVDSTCLDGFKRQIDNLQRDKSALESQISKLKLTMDQRDGDEGRHRGSDVIEQQLRAERNSLEAELRRLKEELASERSRVRELTGAGARRALQERSAAELRHTAHADQLARDLAAQYDLAAKLELDLDRQRRDENDLKRELTMKNAAIEELKIELKNKSATLQADLAQANAEKASLEEELASARLALERQQRQARHDTNRLNSEIHSLRQRLDRSDADLVHSRRENLRLSEQISSLEKELNMKNLTALPSENKKDKELSSMLESMENKHAKTVAELESMIQSQNSLMEKLTGECRSLTDKLDDASRRHKLEKSQLLCRNSELMRKLRNLWSSHKKYCTTTVAPFRSYTPLSGYPSSLYDLDHTYSTSTPYTYRYRRDKSKITNDIDDLNTNLSDLSIDRIDSDDYATKVRNAVDELVEKAFCMVRRIYKEELATLQRQIRDLGQSLPKPPHPPSTYQARSPHIPTADITPAAPTSTRPGHPRPEPSRHSPVRENDGFRDNVNRNNEAEPVVNPQGADIQHSPDDNQYHTEVAQDYENPDDNSQYHTEIDQDHYNPEDNTQYHTEPAQDFQNSVDDSQYHAEEQQNFQNDNDNQYVTEPVQDHQNPDSDIQHEAEAVEKYQHDADKLTADDSRLQQQTNERPREVSEDAIPYDNSLRKEGNSEFVVNENVVPQEYTESQESNDLQYTNPIEPTEQFDEQNYNQTYEQSQYSEQYENYEQYQQEYVDPNAQYENYQTDGNYVEQNTAQYNQDVNPDTVVGEQNYDNTQYNQEYNEYETQNVNETSTPKDNLASES